MLWVPLVLTLGLAMLSFAPRVQESPVLIGSFWAAAMVLVAWQAAMFLRHKGEPARRFLRVELRSQHYLQATVQLAVFAYLLLREGGTNLMEMPEPDLYARACDHGWTFACQTAPGVESGGGS